MNGRREGYIFIISRKGKETCIYGGPNKDQNKKDKKKKILYNIHIIHILLKTHFIHCVMKYCSKNKCVILHIFPHLTDPMPVSLIRYGVSSV